MWTTYCRGSKVPNTDEAENSNQTKVLIVINLINAVNRPRIESWDWPWHPISILQLELWTRRRRRWPGHTFYCNRDRNSSDLSSTTYSLRNAFRRHPRLWLLGLNTRQWNSYSVLLIKPCWVSRSIYLVHQSWARSVKRATLLISERAWFHIWTRQKHILTFAIL